MCMKAMKDAGRLPRKRGTRGDRFVGPDGIVADRFERLLGSGQCLLRPTFLHLAGEWPLRFFVPRLTIADVYAPADLRCPAISFSLATFRFKHKTKSNTLRIYWFSIQIFDLGQWLRNIYSSVCYWKTCPGFFSFFFLHQTLGFR